MWFSIYLLLALSIINFGAASTSNAELPSTTVPDFMLNEITFTIPDVVHSILINLPVFKKVFLSV